MYLSDFAKFVCLVKSFSYVSIGLCRAIIITLLTSMQSSHWKYWTTFPQLISTDIPNERIRRKILQTNYLQLGFSLIEPATIIKQTTTQNLKHYQYLCPAPPQAGCITDKSVSPPLPPEQASTTVVHTQNGTDGNRETLQALRLLRSPLDKSHTSERRWTRFRVVALLKLVLMM